MTCPDLYYHGWSPQLQEFILECFRAWWNAGPSGILGTWLPSENKEGWKGREGNVIILTFLGDHLCQPELWGAWGMKLQNQDPAEFSSSQPPLLLFLICLLNGLKFWDSSCLYLQGSGITGVHHHARLFNVNSRDGIGVLIFVWQGIYLLSHFPSPRWYIT